MSSPFSIFKRGKSSGIFIQKNYWFEELTDEITIHSVNEISRHLGYQPIEVHSFWNTSKCKSKLIEFVVVELFTDNIVYVQTRSHPKKLKSEDVQKFMSNFVWEEEYDAINIRDVLQEGVDHESLTIEFLSRVLKLHNTEVNGTFKSEQLGFYLTFTNGVLSSFELDNDLGAWARHFKSISPELVKQYALNSKDHWGEDYDHIFDEINIQFEALANTPKGFLNEYLELHREPKYNTVNFLMLLVCHYDQSIDLENFRILNKGRFMEVKTLSGTMLALGNFIYEFDKRGELKTFRRK
jgi:hypothetical protein